MILTAIKTATAPYLFWLRIAGIVVVLAAAVAAGWYPEHLKLAEAEANFQAAWKAAETQRIAAERDAREEDQMHAAKLSADFEAQLQQMEARHARDRAQFRNALQRPISCPAGQSLALGDVPIPADVLAGLRAAADPDRAAPPGPAASEPQR